MSTGELALETFLGLRRWLLSFTLTWSCIWFLHKNFKMSPLENTPSFSNSRSLARDLRSAKSRTTTTLLIIPTSFASQTWWSIPTLTPSLKRSYWNFKLQQYFSSLDKLNCYLRQSINCRVTSGTPNLLSMQNILTSRVLKTTGVIRMSRSLLSLSRLCFQTCRIVRFYLFLQMTISETSLGMTLSPCWTKLSTIVSTQLLQWFHLS